MAAVGGNPTAAEYGTITKLIITRFIAVNITPIRNPEDSNSNNNIRICRSHNTSKDYRGAGGQDSSVSNCWAYMSDKSKML